MQDIIYRSSPWKSIRLGMSVFLVGLGIGFIALGGPRILEESDSLIRHDGAILSLVPVAILLICLGLMSLIGGLLGFPKITLSTEGIAVRRVTGNNTCAKWTSLGKPEYVGTMIFAKATGLEVDPTTKKTRQNANWGQLYASHGGRDSQRNFCSPRSGNCCKWSNFYLTIFFWLNMAFRNFLVLLVIGVLVFGILHSASQLIKLPSTPLPPEPPEKCSLSAEATRGRVWAHTCKGCHDIAPTTPTRSSGGPNLQNVYMSIAGTVPVPTGVTNFPYPPIVAARDMGIIWNDENLFEYLHNPRAFLIKVTGKTFDGPKTYVINGKTFENPKPFVEGRYYMQFSIGQESDRRDVIAYLKVIKNHPECD